MVGFLSNLPSSDTKPLDLLKVAIPVGVGLASVAIVAIQLSKNTPAQRTVPIPMASIRAGDATHDMESIEDPDAFLRRVEKECGPVFHLKILTHEKLMVVSGQLMREVFMTEDLSFDDAFEEATGVGVFVNALIKSNKGPGSRIIHRMVRDHLSNLSKFTPRIVYQLERVLDKHLMDCQDKLVEAPLPIFQEMIATGMADVFMGQEMADIPIVISTFMSVALDFGMLLLENMRPKTFMETLTHRLKVKFGRPMQHHIDALVNASAPIILERRRQEAEAVAAGKEYERPLDMLQVALDNFDTFGFVDIEDVCGQMLIIVLASVHTTADTSAVLPFFMAKHPYVIEEIYQEQIQVLDQIQQEREELRQHRIHDTVTEEFKHLTSLASFKGTDLDPAQDRQFSNVALKRMVKLDSFVRETFRWRIEKISLVHKAKADVLLSNGMLIAKGTKVAVNILSSHQSPEQGEDVTEFRPWRFVGRAKATSKVSLDHLTWGLGKHACPGRFLATQELKAVAALMVKKFIKIEPQDPAKLDMVLVSRIGVGPTATGLVLTSRHPKGLKQEPREE